MNLTVFWDFNGTIVDDVALCIRSVNRMLDRRGLPLLTSVEAYRSVFTFPIISYYRALGFDFDREPYEELAVEWVANYTEGLGELSIIDGFTDTWKTFRKCGVRQCILSSSERGMLNRQLFMLGLEDHFDEILALDNIYAAGKAAMARKRLGDACQDAFLIGDTPHDADTARSIGAACILFSGGHASHAELEKCGCPVIDSLGDAVPLVLSKIEENGNRGINFL